jgi:hypothetical protein
MTLAAVSSVMRDDPCVTDLAGLLVVTLLKDQ